MTDTQLMPCLNIADAHDDAASVPPDWQQLTVDDYGSAEEMLELLEEAGYSNRQIARDDGDFLVRWRTRA